jgi:hypothetical protein
MTLECIDGLAASQPPWSVILNALKGWLLRNITYWKPIHVHRFQHSAAFWLLSVCKLQNAYFMVRIPTEYRFVQEGD